MVVYTPLSLAEAAPALKGYALGKVRELSQLAGGTTNSNFKLETDEGLYVLTLLEPAEEAAQISWLPAYLKHLEEHGLPVATIVKTNSGKNSCAIKGKTAIVVPFLNGHECAPSPESAYKAGRALATLNLQSADYPHKSPSPWGLEALKAKILQAQTDAQSKETLITLNKELEQITPQPDLPQGVTHTDLFPDNVLFAKGEVSGLIDFYKAGYDALAYDLAMGLVAWGFDEDSNIMPDTFKNFFAGYTSQRPLQPAEHQAMPMLLRRACCCIALMRTLRSQMLEKSDIKPRSPAAYIKRLAFFKQTNWENIING